MLSTRSACQDGPHHVSRLVWVVLAVATGIFLGHAIMASGYAIFKHEGGNWLHHHTRTYALYNGIDQDNPLRGLAWGAGGQWDQKTILGLPGTYDHNSARIHLIDGTYGRTRWAGLAYWCHHCTHSHVKYNLTYLSGKTPYYRRAVACQEIGHILGLDHAPGDCMGAGYHRQWTNGVDSDTATSLSNKYINTGH